MMNVPLQAALGAHPWADSIVILDTIDSTNNYAKTLAIQGACHGTVVLAEHQTGGKGRLGRSFSSPKGKGVYLSAILRFDAPPAALMRPCATLPVPMRWRSAWPSRYGTMCWM